MSQLVINNLEFCKSSELNQDRVKGSQGGIFEMDLAFDGAFKVDAAGEAAAGGGAAVAIAIGSDNPTVFTITATE
jgi:hypothetical protein